MLGDIHYRGSGVDVVVAIVRSKGFVLMSFALLLAQKGMHGPKLLHSAAYIETTRNPPSGVLKLSRR